MALLHAEDVVKPQLLFAPLDEEAVGVVEKDDAENGHHDHAEAHDQNDRLAAGQGLAQADGAEDEEAGHRHDGGQQKGQVKAAVIFDVARRQTQIEAFHSCSPPVASTVSVSLIF